MIYFATLFFKRYGKIRLLKGVKTMKYSICCRDDINSKMIKEKIHASLNENGWIFDEVNPDIIISVGGDGTYLRAFHQYIEQIDHVKFIGIHTGKLGFFCEFTRNEVDDLINSLLHEEPKIIEHNLLDLTYKDVHYYGINEVRIENPYNTMICNVYVHDELLENFRGNGLNFASTTGASAYNRSLGGPLLDPNIETIIMGEVASINHNAYRSLNSFLVLNKGNVIRLQGNFKRCLIGYDHLFTNINDSSIDDEVMVTLSNKTMKTLHYKDVSYIYRLRKAFVAD